MNLGHEDECREFKKSTSELKEGVESIASILNKHGEGTLYFGVKADGEVCGQDVSESTLRQVSQTIGTSIRPAIYPVISHESTEDGKSYVKVTFVGEDAPYACNGKYRIRVADEDILMSPEELRARFREEESRRNPWDRRVSSKTVDDIDEPTLRRFVERGQKKGRITFDYTTTKDVLDRLGLMDGDRLLNAGRALFCPSPLIDLKMGVLATHARTEILALEQESGLMFDLVRKAEGFIVSNTRSRVDTSTGGPSPVYPEIPIPALHEGLMNAYAHRDWENGGAVIIDIYNDAIEIISPGWFIEGQDPDDHLSGKSVSPATRNGLIAKTLFSSGDIESYGTGIKRIKDLCDEANIRVEYVHVLDGTKLVFHRNDAFGQSLVIDATTHGEENNLTDNMTNGRLNVGLNDTLSEDRDARLVQAIMTEPESTAASLAEELGISERTVRRDLRRLQEKGIVSREGSRKTGRWVIVGRDA